MTEYAVLALLVHVRGPTSGYDLRKLATSGVGYIWAPSKTQLYTVLGRLVDRGLATRRDVAQRRRPDKQLYRVTPAGRAAVRDWLGSVDTEADPDRSTFILKLFFGSQGDRAALRAQLVAFRDSYARRLDVYEQKAHNRTSDSDPFTFSPCATASHARAPRSTGPTRRSRSSCDRRLARRTGDRRPGPGDRRRRPVPRPRPRHRSDDDDE